MLKNNVTEISENNCYGCSACSSICKFGAIEMLKSSKGFLVPKLNEEKCIECGKCYNVCPASNKNLNVKLPQDGNCYAVRHRSDRVRYASSSGGAFTAICDTYDKAYFVGAAMINKKVEHVCVSNDRIDLLRKSKYVQSDMANSYSEVSCKLTEGDEVVFCGTPCQCDGLRSYLQSRNIKTDKLLIVDFICHGTLSPRIFSDFLSLCEKKKNKKVIDHCFRGKERGWHTHIGVNTFCDGQKDASSFDSQLFTALFCTNYAFKEACYSCKYTSTARVSDITLADFWGIEKHLADFDDNKGVSFVMVNTARGREVFDRIDSADIIPASLEWTSQTHLYTPVRRPDDNDNFWRYYEKHGFAKMSVKYLKAGKLRRALSKTYRAISRLLK